MSDTESGFQKFLRTATQRMRVQRLINWAGLSLRYLAALLVVAMAALLVFPQTALVILAVLASAGAVWLATLAAAWFRPVDAKKTARMADAKFGLPDHTLTSSELHSEKGGGWLRLQHEDTTARLRDVDWKSSWPMRWPRFSALAGAAVVLLGGLVALRLTVYAPEAPVVAEQTGLGNEAATVEELLKDWEKAAELTGDPELKNLLAELQPMREQLPKMTEREMLLTLSKIENKLEALREAAGKESLEASAADMAAAFENVEGMSALAAALRQKNFEKADKLAEKEAEKLSQPGAETPKGAEQAVGQMSKAAQKLEKTGRTEAASAMQQASQSAAKKDPAGLGKAMGQLSKCLAREASRQAASSRLGLQLAQIGQCKGGMGENKGEGMGMGAGLSLLPKLSEMKSPGKGAGSETDPNRFGDPTQSETARTQENLTGAAGEGESETEALSSDAPSGEAPRSGKAAQFAQYEKLSRQAIADESLPLAYRETIKKYFEAIRPADK